MPSIMGRMMTGSLRGLKLGAKMIGANPVATIFIGLSARQETKELPEGVLRKAQITAEKLGH